MKISARKEDLLEALKKVAPICGSRTLPIASNVLIETTKTGIDITGTNTVISIKSNIRCQVIEEGATTFLASKLTQIIETLPDDIELSDGLIESDKIKIKLESIEAKNFPNNLFGLEAENQLEIKSDILLKGIEKTLYTTDLNQQNILSGINISANNESIAFYSIDGNVASEYVEAAESTQPFNLILPSDTAKEALRIFRNGEDLTLLVNNGALIIDNGDVILKSRLINGEFPDVKQFLDAERDNKLIINKEYLNSLIKRCQILRSNVKGEKPILKFVVTGNRVDFSFKDVLTETTIAEKQGDDITIGFVLNYLAVVIKNIESSNLTFELKDGLSVALMRDKNYRCLIAPCRV